MGQSMKERPILFSAPMVRALLRGAKTQTRRIVKPQPGGDVDNLGDGETLLDMASGRALRCPYGSVGDRLWVRETHQFVQLPNERIVVYRATCEDDAFDYVDPVEGSIERIEVHKWRPAIFMRRLESRIQLELTAIRVERLHDITEIDALAEGVEGRVVDSVLDGKRGEYIVGSARDAFAHLWAAINGADSWKANPWVWALTFERVEDEP